MAKGLLNSVQGWSFGVTASIDVEPTLDQLQAIANAASTHFDADLFAASSGFALKANVATTGQWNQMTCYYYAASATQAHLVANADPTGVEGTLSTNFWPPQCAVVASLRTGIAGRNNRGRIYMPFGGGTLTSAYQLSSTEVGNIATSVANWLTDMNEDDAFTAVDAGIIAGSNGEPVTQVTVDSVVDTQRRRRDKVTPVSTGSADVSFGGS